MVATADVLDRVTCLCSGSHHRKQELAKELQRNGVNFDVRKLNVGDFLWVAREKLSPVPGNSNAWEQNQCVAVKRAEKSLSSWTLRLQVSCERLQAGSSSSITSLSGNGWTTCVAASSTGASGSRR